MGGPLGHPTAAAAGAEPAALAREGHQPIEMARAAPKAGEAGGKRAALQELAKLSLFHGSLTLA